MFETFPDQLSRHGMTQRIGDAMRRGALSHGPDGEPDVDFMRVDWFRFADLPLDEATRRFGITTKSATAIAAGTTSPWGPAGISPTQLSSGRQLAQRLGVRYDSYGATP